MKNLLANILRKPKIVIPVTLLIAIGIGVKFYDTLGQAPIVSVPTATTTTDTSIVASTNSVDLAFIRTGTLSTVSVATGDKVYAGEVLATIDGGDAQGAVNQTKGALELAKAQYASLNVQYANAKNQQDVLVKNAYRTLLSSGIAAFAQNPDGSHFMSPVDNSQIPTITGTYSCDKEGSYEIDTYRSAAESGYSFTVKGLETGSGSVTFQTPQPLGTCGLFIQFPVGYTQKSNVWIVSIPNEKSANYAANKNAYDLAVTTRDQVLKQFEANLGTNGSSDANIAQAAIDAAQGAYETALAAYKNTLMVAPITGMISFIDSHLKVGQSVIPNKTLITIVKN